jgi:hypothetical protein
MNTKFRCVDNGKPMTVRRESFRRLVSIDEFPDTSWLDDEPRLEAFQDGTWHMIGIQAAATFLIPLGGHFVVQTVESPGLWGIESDSDEAYLDEVYAEECGNLAEMLKTLGVAVSE